MQWLLVINVGKHFQSPVNGCLVHILVLKRDLIYNRGSDGKVII